MSGRCTVQFETNQGMQICGNPATAKNMCDAHRMQKSRGIDLKAPRNWSHPLPDNSHIESVNKYIEQVTWLAPDDPTIIGLRTVALELDRAYSNATLNQYRLLLKDIRDAKPKVIVESEEERAQRLLDMV